jgi:hypothetical protein
MARLTVPCRRRKYKPIVISYLLTDPKRLADAIMRGGALDVLVRRLQARQARREEVLGVLAPARSFAQPPATEGLDARLRAKLADWRGLLTRNVESGRDVLRALLVGPLRFTPVLEQRKRAYRFTGTITLEKLLSGLVELPTRVTSPEGFEPSFQPRKAS